MNKFYFKKFLPIILTISLFSFGSNLYLPDVKINTPINDNPKTALSANLAAWIIIAGDRYDHDKVEVIKSGCNQAYEALINRGFTGTDIYYLGPDYGTPSIYQENFAYSANIREAILTWAPNRGVDATHGLGIYMFDHGGEGVMGLPGAPDLYETDLNSWLHSLETITGCKRIIIIYEACHAGSFINPISEDNRIILTATDAAHGSYVNPTWDWATFSEGFWSSIMQCKTIGKAFEDAEAYVESVGDGYRQFPLIDDNHDEEGHETDTFGHLPNGGDGDDALAYWIGTGTNCPKIYIAAWALTVFINISSFLIPSWTVIDTDTLIERVYVRVIPPNWTPTDIIPEPTSDDGTTKLGVHTGYLITQLLDDDKDGNYTGNLYNPNLPDFWSKKGDYKIDIFAETEEGVIAEVETTYITVNDDGEPPPDTTPPTIIITNPDSNAGLIGIVNITAEGDDDQALEKIQLYLDGYLLKEETMPDYYPYPELIYSLDTVDYSFGLHNITARAIDKVGNEKETTILVTFERENEIPGPQIHILIIGSIAGIIIVYVINLRKRKNK